MTAKLQSKLEKQFGGVAIYHVVYKREKFEIAAQTLLRLVKTAETKFPGKPRRLYLDIEGHRNPNGGFDFDMFELQNEFVIGFLSKFLSSVSMPLGSYSLKGQNDLIPDVLEIKSSN
jgi:hypothetical protein